MKRLLLGLWLACYVATPVAFAGQSRNFDGVDDKIDVGSASDIDNLKPGSFAAWIKADTTGEGGVGRLYDKVRKQVQLTGTNRLRYERETSGTHLVVESNNNAISLGTWHFVAVTWANSNTASNTKIYVDGTEVNYATQQNATGTDDSDGTHQACIGNTEGQTQTFDGLIAHAHLYNRTLTSTEVGQIKDSPGSVTSGLLGYWPLTGSGSTEPDGSGNGRTGTVTGATESSDGPPIGGDTEPPSGTVSINAGATLTNSTNVTLTLSATDNSGTVAQMQFSNDDVSYSEPPDTYATSKGWTLTTGDGGKTVYAKFKDPSGNWSDPVTDTITLDTTAPNISAVSASNITQTGATITWTTDETADSMVEYGLTTSYGQSASDTPLVTNHSIDLTGLSDSTTYHYRVQSTDAAGNQATSSDATFQTGADVTPPTNTSISINGGAVATNSATVTLTLSATDPSGVALMRFSNDNGATYSAPETYSTTRTGWVLPSGDGSKTVLAQFADTPGNWSNAVSDAIILDTAAPSIEITSPADGAVVLP
jgi:hypothetical protein